MDQDRVDELFAAFGPVRIKRMFGGHGLYADGLMFALETRGVLYLKCGPSNEAAFEAEGLEPFGYDTKTGRHVLTSYRRAPEAALDDPDEMATWARGALLAAKAADAAKPAKSRKKSAD